MSKNSRLIIKHIVTWLSAVAIVFIVVDQGAIRNFKISVHQDYSVEIEASFYNAR